MKKIGVNANFVNKILSGISKVVVDEGGDHGTVTVSPEEAKVEGVDVDVVYVRDDGLTIGCPHEFADITESMYDGFWVYRLLNDRGKWVCYRYKDDSGTEKPELKEKDEDNDNDDVEEPDDDDTVGEEDADENSEVEGDSEESEPEEIDHEKLEPEETDFDSEVDILGDGDDATEDSEEKIEDDWVSGIKESDKVDGGEVSEVSCFASLEENIAKLSRRVGDLDSKLNGELERAHKAAVFNALEEFLIDGSFLVLVTKERDARYRAEKALDAFLSLSEISNRFRNRLKYGPSFNSGDAALEWAKKTVFDVLDEHRLNIDEGLA